MQNRLARPAGKVNPWFCGNNPWLRTLLSRERGNPALLAELGFQAFLIKTLAIRAGQESKGQRVAVAIRRLAQIVACLAMTCLGDQPASASRIRPATRLLATHSRTAKRPDAGRTTVPGCFQLVRSQQYCQSVVDRSGPPGPTTAAEAGAETLGAARLKAAGQWPKSAQQVLVIYADESAGNPYCDPLDYPEAPFGLALLLRPAADGQTNMALHWQKTHTAYEALPRHLLAFLNTQPNTLALGASITRIGRWIGWRKHAADTPQQLRGHHVLDRPLRPRSRVLPVRCTEDFIGARENPTENRARQLTQTLQDFFQRQLARYERTY